MIPVVIPGLNQGKYLEQNLVRLFSGAEPDISVALMDAGSTDGSIEIIKKYQDRLKYWRSHPDAARSAAINEEAHTADTAERQRRPRGTGKGSKKSCEQ